MGKGTKKKTVWRTFSFENGYTNGNGTDETNGLTEHHHHQHQHQHHHQKNGSDSSHDTSNRSSISNGKYISSWRAQRYGDDSTNENDLDAKIFDSNNGNVNGCTDNDHRTFYKRAPLTDKYPLRGNGFRKAPSSSYSQENGIKSDTHDIYENHSSKPSQFRFNRSPKVQSSTARHSNHNHNHKKWDSRNGNYHSNGILNNYSRGIRKPHSDQQDAHENTNNNNNNNDEHFNENGLVKNARDADDSDKCQDKANDGSSAQLKYDQAHHHRSLQLNKFNEDEYTRISTPRSEVLFKKGYLMRDKKYVGPTNMVPTTATSSNDSGSVSVVSNEETASYYSIQSMSPDHSTYLNGNSSNDSTPATYPSDGFEHDLSLVYSSGFYDNSGYFYVNPYLQNNFDQFNGPTILMPYGSAPNAKDVYGYDVDAFPPASMSPATGDAKSVDEEHANNFNSINSEEMSNSSLSENISINNDPDTPPSPLTPPPSPLSPNEKPIARSEVIERNNQSDNIDGQNTTDIENVTENNENGTEVDENNENIENNKDAEGNEATDTDVVTPDNYSMPYFSPFIFVPPIPFVPDARLAGSRRGKFRRHSSNQFGRPKRSNRFSHFYNKVYIPNNWSEAPEENDQNMRNGDDVSETKSNEDEKSAEPESTSTIEQCDKILKNSKLNLNVSEFIPQSKRMIFVPLPITPSPTAPVYFVPIPSTESTLNVNVPEFLPKNYKPLNETNDDENEKTALTTPTAPTTNGNDVTINSNESAEKQNETTINRTNGLNTDDHDDDDDDDDNPKCNAPQNAQNLNEPQLLTNGVHDDVDNNDGHATNETVTQIKQNHVVAPIMSDLLKTNNLNLDARRFNSKINSHTNLKADLGSKNDTNNSKHTIYKNDKYSNGSGSTKSYKLNTSNKTVTKTRQAYPKTTTIKETQPAKAWEGISSMKNDHQLGDAMNVSHSTTVDGNNHENGKVSSEKPAIEKPGLTYAQMVVPTKQPSVTTRAAPIITPYVTEPTKVLLTENTPKVLPIDNSPKPLKSALKSKPTQNTSMSTGGDVNRKNRYNNKKTVTDNRTDKSEKSTKPIDGPVEWFTVGAKGKKHVAPNGSTVIDIAFENESKAEKVNKIAEELQLDIKKDADLAMDIMDSLAITEEKPDDVAAAKAQRKKKVTFTPASTKSKKKAKDKSNKEQKRTHRDTFDIIEPSFELEKKKVPEAKQEEDDVDDALVNEEQVAAEEAEPSTVTMTDESDASETNIDVEAHDTIEANAEQLFNDIVFDPNVFATPCNLQMDSVQRASNGKLGNSLRLSTGKVVRNLINQFDIYQPDYTSIENQQLKQEEEMVIKILQQLNKSADEKESPKKNEPVEKSAEPTAIIETEFTVDKAPARENSVERFAINAKPYQNVYSSNHFLDHVFGDRNRPSDLVDHSTDLSSSDQSHVEEYEERHDDFNFNTYPAIDGGNDDDDDGDEIGENPPEVKIEIEEVSQCENQVQEENEIEIEIEIEDKVEIDEENNNEIGETKVEIVEHELNLDGVEIDAQENELNLSEDDKKIEENLEIQFEKQPELKAFEVEDSADTLADELIPEEKSNDEQSQQMCSTDDNELEIQSESNQEIEAQEENVEPEKMIEIDVESDIKPLEHTQTETETEAETEAETKAETKAETETETEPELEKKTEIEIKIENEIGTEVELKPEPEPDTEVSEIVAEIAAEKQTELNVHETELNDAASSVSCNQSVKSNASNNAQPWIRIVDTQTLQQQKKMQQTFPITTAVSMWLNQAQKEKTPEPMFRLPDYRFFSTATKYKKTDSQASHSNSSIDLTEDTASVTSDKFHINDDEEEDIMNFWESPSVLTPQSPTPPPIYNSVYGNSINYANLLSNKNELLCNNIVDYDRLDATSRDKVNEKNSMPQLNLNKNGFNQTNDMTTTTTAAASASAGMDEKCYRPPPEVCCTIM